MDAYSVEFCSSLRGEGPLTSMDTSEKGQHKGAKCSDIAAGDTAAAFTPWDFHIEISEHWSICRVLSRGRLKDGREKYRKKGQ